MSGGKWSTVSRAHPCPSCGKDDWCSVSPDRSKRTCWRRPPAGVPYQTCKGNGGKKFYLFAADALGGDGATVIAETGTRVAVADIGARDAVYTAIVETLGTEVLSADHTHQLLRRGLTAAEIARNGYFTFPAEIDVRQRCVAAARRVLGATPPECVPGLYREGDDPEVFLVKYDGLAIPVRDTDGRIAALRVRVEKDGEKKYLWLTGPTAPNTVGSSPGVVCHVPLHDPTRRTGEVRIAEGEFKADLATLRTGVLTISVPGVGNAGAAIPVLRTLGTHRVRLAFDGDARTNPAVANALQGLAAACAEEGWEVSVETWPMTWKGIDDALVAPDGGTHCIETHAGPEAWETIAAIVAAAGAEVDPGIPARACIERLRPKIAAAPDVAMSKEAVEAAAALRVHASKPEFRRFANALKKLGVPTREWNGSVKEALRELVAQREPEGPENPEGLPQVILGPNEAEVADEVIARLAASKADLYQRGGALVRVVSDDLGPRIEALPRASVRELIARHVLLVQHRMATEDGAPVSRVERVNVPLWLAEAVASRGSWDGIRPLRGVVENAVLRANGTVLAAQGYDAESQLMLVPAGDLPLVPERPTAADVVAAKALLLDVICDFPFQDDAHRSTWLSALLVCLARPAIDGPVPLHAIDGNLRGAGKTLLADVIAYIVFGRPMPRRAYVPNAEELKKTITSIAASNPAVVLFDNVAAPLAGAALDMVLSGQVVEDRLFGRNDTTIRYRTSTLWLASGNNLVFGGDLVRRVLVCRLSSQEESPERRSDFRHPRLVEHVQRHRVQLAAAALTLLRAYVVAGRPRMNLSSLGSFEAYSALVRETLVFHNFSDPALSREAVPDEARSLLSRLTSGWLELYPKGGSVTVADVLQDLRTAEPGKFSTLEDALEEMGDGPLFKQLYGGERAVVASPISLAKRLDAHRDRVVGGFVLQKLPKGKAGVRWRVVKAGTPLPMGDGSDGSDGSSSPHNQEVDVSRDENESRQATGAGSTVATVATVTSTESRDGEEFRP